MDSSRVRPSDFRRVQHSAMIIRRRSWDGNEEQESEDDNIRLEIRLLRNRLELLTKAKANLESQVQILKAATRSP